MQGAGHHDLMLGNSGYMYVEQPDSSSVSTNLLSPGQPGTTLSFLYRSSKISEDCKLELWGSIITAAVSSFTQELLWWTRCDSQGADEWRKVKLDLHPHAVLFRFDSAGGKASIAKLNIVTSPSNNDVPWAFIACGGSHTCVLLTSDDSIKCWGYNLYGQLGQGTRERIGDTFSEMGDYLHPVDLGIGRSAKQISAGESHTCALLDDDSLKCWGYNLYGQLGQGTRERIGDTFSEMGDYLHPVDLGIGRSAKQISAGESHTCALLDDDSLKCWGSNHYGQLGQGTMENIGDGFSEMGDYLQPVDLGTGRTAKQISAGHYHTCALLDDDSIKCWGYNLYGQLGQGTRERIGDTFSEMGDYLHPVDLGIGRSAKQISAGHKHTCALLDDGSVKCWGENLQGQLGQGTTESIGDGFSEMGDYLQPVDLGIGRSAKQISAGESHTCALLDDDSIKCWGSNHYGQLGQGTMESIGDETAEMGDYLPPVELGTGRLAKQISAGDDHTCAVLDNDSLKCWGRGEYGQLGHGTTATVGFSPGQMGDRLAAIDFGATTMAHEVALRLAGGTSLRGRVQVQYKGLWGDVCDDKWGAADAEVVCQQLGLGGGLPSLGWVGSGDFWMDDVQCLGTETNLGQCPFRGWGVHDCGSREAAGVVCHIDAWSHLGDANLSARTEHAAVWDSQNASMLVFGGHESAHFQYYSDLHLYNQASSAWLRSESFGPSSKSGHTAVLDSSSGTMIVFGGIQTTVTSDELWLYSLHTNSWHLSTASMRPEARAYHSTVLDAEKQLMLVFAGLGVSNLNDLWEYSIASDTWRELLQETKPSSRSRHSAVWLEMAKAMLVFGGWDVTPLGELWYYSSWTNSWLLMNAMNPSLAGHSAVWDDVTWSMLVFGGTQLVNGSEMGYSSVLWNYSMVTNSWKQMATSPRLRRPSARQGHTAVLDSSSRFLFLLGGFNSTYMADMWRYKGQESTEVAVKTCFSGQDCTLEFSEANFADGAQLAAEDMFSGANFGLFDALDSQRLAFRSGQGNQNLQRVLMMEPGIYRLTRNSSDGLASWTFGFLVSEGPFLQQVGQCFMGSDCSVVVQGVGLSIENAMVALKSCGTAETTQSFSQQLQIIANSSNSVS